MTGFIDSPLGKVLNRFYTKTGDLPKAWQPFIMVRFMSMSHNKDIRDKAVMINRYTFPFYNKKWLMEALIDTSIKKHDRIPFTKFIKKTKVKETKYDDILKEMQRYFKWTNRELGLNRSLIISELDKGKIKQVLDFIGADIKLYKKFALEIKKPVKQVRTVFSF